METKLHAIGLTAERFAAVDGRFISKRDQPVSFQPAEPSSLDAEVPSKSVIGLPSEVNHLTRLVRGYESAGRYALALTQRLALREAARRRAPAVLLLEDDVVFHPNFRSLLATVELPDDWGIFYLGCSHRRRPEWAGARVVASKYAVDTHAVAVRSPYYRVVMQMLDRHVKPDLKVARASDQYLALLHEKIPTYACHPNLAWQAASTSDLAGQHYTNYGRDGQQRNFPESVSGMLDELVNDEMEPAQSHEEENSDRNGRSLHVGCRCTGVDAPSKPSARVGLLFLTRGDVHHPEIWREFVSQAPDRVRIFSHPKVEEEISGGFLTGTSIRPRFETAWGDISLVRASRALLLAALEDTSLTHFALLSESCVPIRPLEELLRRVELDPRSQFDYRTLQEAHPQHAARSAAVPELPHGCWRFTSQWWLLNRAAAVFATAEDYTPMFERMSVPDEAYFATILSLQGYPLDGNVIKKNVTWTWWEKNAGHPTEWLTLPQEKLELLLHSDALFARKFPRGADIRKYGLHRQPYR